MLRMCAQNVLGWLMNLWSGRIEPFFKSSHKCGESDSKSVADLFQFNEVQESFAAFYFADKRLGSFEFSREFDLRQLRVKTSLFQ